MRARAHFVYEADFCGEKGVASILDEFGGRQVGPNNGRTVFAIERFVKVF